MLPNERIIIGMVMLVCSGVCWPLAFSSSQREMGWRLYWAMTGFMYLVVGWMLVWPH